MNTTYFMNLIMGNVFRTKTSPAIPTKYYVGLSTSAPTINGGNVSEPNPIGSKYARIEVTGLSAPINGVIKNTKDLIFEESMTSWGTVTHYVVYDAPVSGNLLFYNTLSLSRTVEPNTSIIIRAEELEIKLSNVTE